MLIIVIINNDDEINSGQVERYNHTIIVQCMLISTKKNLTYYSISVTWELRNIQFISKGHH